MTDLYVGWSAGALSADDLLRRELRRWYDVAGSDLAVVRACPRCGSDTHGVPVVTGWPDGRPPHVSLARCPDLVVVAFSSAGPVGVDVERWDAASFEGFSGVALHPAESADDELARTRTWVRKESLLKATGHGLTMAPERVALTAPDRPPELVSWEGPGRPTSPVWLYDVPAGPDHVVAASVLATERPVLRT